GQPRSILVHLDARRLAERGIAADKVVQAVQASNIRLPAGSVSGSEGVMNLEAGAFLKSAADTGVIIVGANASGPIYLRDVATISEGAAEVSDYVSRIGRDTKWAAYPAITLSVTKVDRSNVTEVTRDARAVLDKVSKDLLTSGMHMEINRDSGQTAMKTLTMVNEHMLMAIVISIILISIVLGWRASIITAVSLGVTLLFVPIVYYLTGFTLNRMTLCAMVFAIGLLVDNSIVVIENVHRRLHSEKGSKARIIALAVQEIGPPTILATVMVICALMPTAFLTGIVGEYMQPLPLGSSFGMAFSMLVAITVTPYLCYWLIPSYASSAGHEHQEPAPAKDSRIKSTYLKALAWFMERPARMYSAYAISTILLVGVVLLIPARVCVVSVLPHKDMDELSVMIDLPPNTQLEDSYTKVAE
ncbi:efflux RND transporter permease subunit, partial [bacterium]|nr:efflux RND transporter permease subunit [bacterium]